MAELLYKKYVSTCKAENNTNGTDAATNEADDKNVQAYAALTLITSCCHGVLNTNLIEPTNKKFEWFDGLKAKLDEAKVLAAQWINEIAPDIQSSIPSHVILFNNQFQATTDFVLDICEKNPDMKKGDKAFDDANALLTALAKTIEDDILIPIDKYNNILEKWGEDIQKVYDDMSVMINDIQNSEVDLQSEIDAMNAKINALNEQVNLEQSLVGIGAGLVGGGVFVSLIGVCLIASGVGALVGGIVTGIGAVMAIGGAVTWGVMQANIDKAYDEIAEFKKNIRADQQLVASLKGIELAACNAVNYMHQAQSALDEVKTMWMTFGNIISDTETDLNKAVESATAILKKMFTETAKNQWQDAEDTAKKLINSTIEVKDEGKMGDDYPESA